MIDGVDTAILAIGALLAGGFGYAAQRGSICAVRGVELLIDRGSPRLFLAFLACSAWVVVVSGALTWLWPDAAVPSAARGLSTGAIAGAALFGVGAAANGGCSFSTVLRLAAGDLSFAATLFGLSAGFQLSHEVMLLAPAPVRGPSPLLASPGTAALVWLVGALVAAASIARLRLSLRDPVWDPRLAAALMGICGGALYALEGPWMYTSALDRGVLSMMDAASANTRLAVLFVALLGGAGLAARRTGRWRLVAAPGPILQRLAAGTIMGFGAAAVPGGNDVLVLHALPALSPHALPAYAALVTGVAAAIVARRAIERGWRHAWHALGNR